MSTDESGIILAIDDNPNNLGLLYDILAEYGYDLLVEMDGESGIEQVKKNPPDLILLDVMMPGIDGFETCWRLQADPETRDIPIIFMTALSDTVDKVKGLSLGAVDYITKPFQNEEVIARIKVHLKLRRLNLELKRQKQQLEERVRERTVELSQALEDLQKAQIQLVQNEKMSSIGQLVAGVAHEINNPVGFISGNIDMATQGVLDLIKILELYKAKFPNPGEEIERKSSEIELEYLLEDLPQMILSMKSGTDRIRNISIALRTFSRGDTATKVLADIHEGLDSTLAILQYRLKSNNKRPEILVIKEYGKIPQVSCYLGKLNQVFMNIISNAIDAFEEKNGDRPLADLKAQPNLITIQTEITADTRKVYIKIKDNGMGMSEEVREQIFDQLFTTKPVGKGTGLGLSISRQIVEETHSGSLSCHSVLGEGTEFEIVLPIQDN